LEPLIDLLRSTICAPAVLGILMYFYVHSGSSAPATRKFSSLATVNQRFLSLHYYQIFVIRACISRCETEQERNGEYLLRTRQNRTIAPQ